jgi:hypothetical protein
MCSFPSPVQPTLTGYIASTKDANLAVQACLAGHLLLVPRRPNNLERSLSIKSGSVFIYEERMSGIKRWTDGLPPGSLARPSPLVPSVEHDVRMLSLSSVGFRLPGSSALESCCGTDS